MILTDVWGTIWKCRRINEKISRILLYKYKKKWNGRIRFKDKYDELHDEPKKKDVHHKEDAQWKIINNYRKITIINTL